MWTSHESMMRWEGPSITCAIPARSAWGKLKQIQIRNTPENNWPLLLKKSKEGRREKVGEEVSEERREGGKEEKKERMSQQHERQEIFQINGSGRMMTNRCNAWSCIELWTERNVLWWHYWDSGWNWNKDCRLDGGTTLMSYFLTLKTKRCCVRECLCC